MDFIKPQLNPEATIQSDLYQELKKIGIDVHLNYRHKNSIFDIVIAKKNKIALLIEVKKQLKNSHFKSEQAKKYGTFNAPLLFIGSGLRLDMVAVFIRNFVELDMPEEKYHNPEVYRQYLTRLQIVNENRQYKAKTGSKHGKMVKSLTWSAKIKRQSLKQRIQNNKY
jgi:hypothetical protein